VILLLNPNYFPEESSIPSYLKRLGYELIDERKKVLSERDVKNLFEK